MITLIIPHSNQINDLTYLLNGITQWKLKPDEIILIDSSVDSFTVNSRATNILQNFDGELKIIHRSIAYPGTARNIGIRQSKGEFLAFLDVKTIPEEDWLYLTINLLLKNPDASGIYGSTQYISNNKFSNLVRLATYGITPLQTLPGSIIRRGTIYITGSFIESSVAGEDAEWMSRVRLHRLNMLKANSIVFYTGLDELTLMLLLKKYFRNYKAAAKLPYLYAHKSIYYNGLVLLFLITTFNWNWVVAGWDTNSDFYIPHITKVVVTSILLLYISIRGLVMPLRKGAKWLDLLPFKWLFVAGISTLLDCTKILAFARGRWVRE